MSESDWTNMNPTGAPSTSLINLAMVYDSSADRMIAYGGYDGSDDGSDQTWAYDFESNAWSNLAPEVHPNATMVLRAAYDSWAQRTILFGGWIGTVTDGTYSNETWAYDFGSNSWTDLQPAWHPSARSRQGMAFDAQSGRTILFGGHTIDNEYSDETWAYNLAGNTWTDMAPGIHPPGRRSPGMVYDSNADRMILFGGWDPFANLNNAYNDTWAYDFETNTWTNMSPARAPVGRFGFGFAYDSGVDRCILFGGIGDGSVATWAYDFTNNTWSVMDVDHSPPWHAFQGMAYDTQSARTIMFGGDGGSGNDTWALATATGPPSAPGAFLVRPGNGYLNLSWKPPTDAGLSPVTAYRIYRGMTPGAESLFTELGVVESWTDTNVTNGETYYYQVSAVNANGEGPRTREIGAAPDGTPPETSALLGGTLGDGGWYVGPVYVYLNATDDSSGVSSTTYRIDGGDWQAYGLPVQVTADGSHTVDFYSTDRAGNVEPAHTQMISIDTEAPTASASLPSPSASGWYTSPIPVTITASDDRSGVASVLYRIDGGAWQTYAGPFLFTSQGTHTLDYVAVDHAGNQGPLQSVFVRLDSVAPHSEAILQGAAGEADWFLSTVTVAITATDATSGVTSILYRIDGGAWQAYTGMVPIGEGRHSIEYYATDSAGVVEPVNRIAANVDTTAPILGGLAPRGIVTTSSVQISWTGTDAGSGIDHYDVQVDRGAFTSVGSASSTQLQLTDGSHTIVVRAVDRAGNVASTALTVIVDTSPFSASGPYGAIPTYAVVLAVIAVAVVSAFLVLRRRKRAA